MLIRLWLIYDCLLDSKAREQSVAIKAVFVFVGDANANHSAWLESIPPTDRTFVMLLIFEICRVVSS